MNIDLCYVYVFGLQRKTTTTQKKSLLIIFGVCYMREQKKNKIDCNEIVLVSAFTPEPHEHFNYASFTTNIGFHFISIQSG